MATLLLLAAEELLELVAARFGGDSFSAHSHGGPAVSKDDHTAHEEHACDHTVEEHVAMDGACDAQPLEELCTHGKTEDASSSESDSDVETDKKDGESGTTDAKKNECSGDYEEGQATAVQLFTRMMILFVGLFFHNVFVGLALGFSDNDYELFIAIIFHQFFEGVVMGSRVAMAKLKRVVVVLLIDFVFALTPVLFIGIGIGIKHAVVEADSTDGFNITDGTFQGLSAGILIYVGLIHMLRAYRDANITSARLDLHRLASYLGVLLGAAIMAVIGIWA